MAGARTGKQRVRLCQTWSGLECLLAGGELARRAEREGPLVGFRPRADWEQGSGHGALASWERAARAAREDGPHVAPPGCRSAG